ncbi:MAG: CgeB family protein [Acidimicrobiales bacterium]
MLGPLHPDSFAENITRALGEMGVDATAIDPRSRLTSGTFRPTNFRRSVAPLADLVLRAAGPRRLLIGRPVARRLEEAAPELVLSVFGYLHPEEVERWRAVTPGARWALWYPDSLANLGSQLPFVAAWDRLFFKDPHLVDVLASRTNLPVHFLPEACLPSRHGAQEAASEAERSRYDCDVAVAGNIYPYRVRVLETLPSGIDLKLYGNLPADVRRSPIAAAYTGEYVTDRGKFLAFTCARIVLNTVHYAEVRSVNARLFEATACGGFVVTQRTPGMADLFELGTEVVAVDTAADLRDAILHYLAAPDERVAIAAAGQKRAHADHTYHHRLRSLGEACGF